MIESVWFFLRVWTFWIVYFLVFKLTFLLYHLHLYKTFSVSQWLEVFWHGLPMDVSMASYISIFPLLLWIGRGFISSPIWMKINTWYRVVFLLFFGFILSADLEVFNVWGHRIDSSIVPYLRFPKEAFASSSSSPLRILFSIYGVSFVVSAMIWTARHGKFIQNLPASSWKQSLSGIVLMAVLIIPIRGGIQLAPMNQSSVYFSSERVLNQAAENGLWVLVQSLLESKSEQDVHYLEGSQSEADAVYMELYPNLINPDSSILNNPNPNVVLIIWESLTAKVVGCLEGAYPSTPNLDQLAKNGLLFRQMYANGDRSDKGLASILSSVPALGESSILARPNKTAKLPFLSKALKAKGYQTAYLYGGELEFANMKSYLLNGGFDQLIGKESFSKDEMNSKWGAHDAQLFSKELQLANQLKTPFFHTLFTLSSHEPFEVPGQHIKGNEPHDSLFCRAHRYTDQCLGRWVEEAKKQAWWPNTLVILVADHGHSAPGSTADKDPLKFRIPMLWFGPALNRNGFVETLGNQTDIASTLLNQLRLPGFRFSADLLNKQTVPKAMFAYQHGFTLITSNGTLEVDDFKKEKPNKATQIRRKVFTEFYQ